MVVTYASAGIAAMKVAGIQPVIKHFPGMGSASGNTDFVTATTDPFSVLEIRDIIPYRELAGKDPDVMVGNMIVPGLTNGLPAIWSPEAIQLLRQIGYENAVVYSDSLTANAIPGTIQEAAIKAWVAGIDMAVIVQTRENMPAVAGYIQSIVEAASAQMESGTITKDALDESLQRILSRKNINPCGISDTQ